MENSVNIFSVQNKLCIVAIYHFNEKLLKNTHETTKHYKDEKNKNNRRKMLPREKRKANCFHVS